MTSKKSLSMMAASGALAFSALFGAASAQPAAAAHAETKEPAMQIVKKMDADAIRKNVAMYAASLKGKPYKYGGQSLKGFDASGYISYVYTHANPSKMKVERTIAKQYKQGMTVKSMKDLMPGDVVFFSFNGKAPTFAGIYTGKNMFYAVTSKGVTMEKLNTKYWSKAYTGAKRWIK
ncbi:C40 family peptidase [Peribacillus sp. B-H-3]|uniref:C40 family peptidase n=1 Tax=Peribacillus sp. B-H-3 TaxID=3400420 RepID=UPI003B013727